MKRNDAFLNDCELYKVEADDKIGTKVVLTVNLDIKDRLINDQTGNISHIEFAQGSVRKVYVKFSDEQTDLKEM